MAEGKGKWTSVFQTGGNRFIIRNERRADVASIPTKVEGAADYAHLIVTAVNTYPAVEGLVKALERAQKLVRLVTVRQAIEAGDDAIDAAGLNPWALNEGLAEGSERIGAHFIDSALSRFRSLQNGGAN